MTIKEMCEVFRRCCHRQGPGGSVVLPRAFAEEVLEYFKEQTKGSKSAPAVKAVKSAVGAVTKKKTTKKVAKKT